ncbi:putative ribosome biogenesis GTPase RsgA [Alicyclobacillus cellulosilyticus]|uniref:Small ribosomal subunit biogenesis GTPase RsgA n=1 Tax=Alicyclobacillus cellulosilyticus TaxID=1003997 RepID=A0A917NM45_9BACL|nr:ribosome small subunit-dependent GTPase A [Alicyclobacillus cellulosilyticus]GGJ08165.1 putative ribosome biogenesis GTPase RsgA [Alicyclobacillus cellulosilyticus]
MAEPEGLVTRAVNSIFTVRMGEEVRICRARGVLRKRGEKVLVGDRVRVEPVGSGEGVIVEVLPRRTELVRPPIANVDQALLVFSLVTPDFHHALLDRTLVAVAAAGLDAVIAITKCDLDPGGLADVCAAPYRQAGYRVILCSSVRGDGIADVRQALAGRVTVFAGPSGAGKSSLANAIAPELGLRMGEVSAKLGRGRHTTRHVELFPLGGGTFIADAPGFSQLDLALPAQELRYYFPDLVRAASGCAFRGCLHIEEEEACGVKAAVARGEIPPSRYESYRALYRELREQEENRY